MSLKKFEVVAVMGIVVVCLTGISRSASAASCPAGQTDTGLKMDDNGNQVADCQETGGSACAGSLCTDGAAGSNSAPQNHTYGCTCFMSAIKPGLNNTQTTVDGGVVLNCAWQKGYSFTDLNGYQEIVKSVKCSQ